MMGIVACVLAVLLFSLIAFCAGLIMGQIVEKEMRSDDE